MARFLLFRVPSRLCALALESVVETLRPLEIRAFNVKCEPALGLTVVRGVPLPVIDGAALFGTEAQAVSRFVVVRTGDRGYVLTVESVVGIREVGDDALHLLPPILQDVETEVVEAIGLVDDQFLTVLNDVRLVPDAVWAELERGAAA